MAGAIAATALEGQTRIRGWSAVTTSYPEFARDLAMLTEGSS
jgi:5-enolpyruvylshikimate-3-phosphate synthase